MRDSAAENFCSLICEENGSSCNLVAFENEECVVEDERIVKILHNLQDRVRSRLDRMEDESREEEERRPQFNVYPSEKLIETRNIAGVIIHRDLRLWIIPKLLTDWGNTIDEKREATLAILHHMTSYVTGYSRVVTVTTRRGRPLDLIANLYIKRLRDELVRGVYREHVRTKRESRFIRGKLLLEELLQRYPRSLYFPTLEYWDLSVNTPMNRILYAASKRALIVNTSLGPRAREVMSLLEQAKEIEENSIRDIKLVKFNRLNERFRDVFNLACLLLGFTGILGRELLFFVFNTHTLFEKYLYKVILRTLPQLRVRYQEDIGKHIVVDGEQSSIKPDIILMKREKIPLDVKYVETGSSIPWTHVYQVAFYARVLDSSKAILVYPTVNNSNRPIRIELRNVKKPFRIYILKYNLMNAVENNQYDREFVENLKNILVE